MKVKRLAVLLFGWVIDVGAIYWPTATYWGWRFSGGVAEACWGRVRGFVQISRLLSSAH